MNHGVPFPEEKGVRGLGELRYVDCLTMSCFGSIVQENFG